MEGILKGMAEVASYRFQNKRDPEGKTDDS